MTVLLESHLKHLKLPTFLAHYRQESQVCQDQQISYEDYLLRLAEREVLTRQTKTATQKIKQAQFPGLKTLEGFDFDQLPHLNKLKVLTLAKGEYMDKRDNVLCIGNSGTGKTHLAIALGIAACQKGMTVGFTTAAALVTNLLEARDENALLKFHNRLQRYALLIIDELGFVPFSKTGGELLFDVLSQRYERGSVLITTNLPFEEWTQVFGCERLTDALLDRLTHHIHILEMNGQSYRLAQSKLKKQKEDTDKK